MKRASYWLAALLAAAAGASGAQEAASFGAYQRVPALTGTVQLSGSSVVAHVARAWAPAFQRIYPNVAVNVVAKSSGAAITDMAANPATLGMMSRPMSKAESDAFAKQHGRVPLEMRVAFDAVAIYVFKDNPLASVTLPQLERIFGASPKNGAAIERWGQLALEGNWAERAVHGIGFEPGRGAYEIMRDLVLRGGNFRGDVTSEPVSTSVVQAVGVEPGAIGYASVYFRTARTRVLPVQNATGDVGQPDERDASSGKYPLARSLYLYLPGGSGENNAATREFLRFVLSDEGQNLARASGAFAITPALAREQRAALGK
jgi:phosphate transport system substrate-binding protein